VKILYVRNLMLNTAEETLERIFNEAAGHSGAVERVKKIRDYAFVHFNDRHDAIRALHIINGQWSEVDSPEYLQNISSRPLRFLILYLEFKVHKNN